MIENAVLMFFDFTPKNIIIWIILIGGMSILSMIFMPQLMGLQSKFAVRGAKKSLEKLEGLSQKSRNTALNALSGYGVDSEVVENKLDEFMGFFTIDPVSEDPRGVLNRLDHMLDVRKKRYEDQVKEMAPEADEEKSANLEMAIEGVLSTYNIYKTVRHYIQVAEKTQSYQLVQLLQMQMPLLEKMAESYKEATDAFVSGKPIGDGIGAMVATELIGEAETKEGVENTVHAETEIEERSAKVVKAKGPGGRVGKPGELIRDLVDEDDPDRIIMIDAGLKLEGEDSGKVVEGVGAAIGGPPTEKHKIEKIATEGDIPVDAIVVKEGLKEAITPMSEQLSESVESAVEKVRSAVRERTENEETVIIAGIGNTIGIGQNSEEIPTHFPELEKDEEELESFTSFGGGTSLSEGSKIRWGLERDSDRDFPSQFRPT